MYASNHHSREKDTADPANSPAVTSQAQEDEPTFTLTLNQTATETMYVTMMATETQTEVQIETLTETVTETVQQQLNATVTTSPRPPKYQRS